MEQYQQGERVVVRRVVMKVFRWATPGTGEWSTRMGLGVPRVRLTLWLTDITRTALSTVKLTAELSR